MQAHAASVSTDHQVILVQNETPLPCSQSSGEWLSAAPRGAYTTGRTVGRDSVFEFEFHIQRLASSVKLMLVADAAAHVHSGASQQEAVIPAHLQHIVEVGSLRPLVLSSLRVALKEYWSVNSKADLREVKLTILVTWTSEACDILTHLSCMGPPPPPPVKVVVKGAPRSNAAAKDSEWVRERKTLEDDKPADVNEVVLLDEDGAMFEGLSSNFFAVTKKGVLLTAGDGILPGTVREVLLECCKREGISVELTPPRISDIANWEGAMVSSTSRLALPIDQLSYTSNEGPREVEFKTDTVTRRIASLVQQAIQDNCTKIM